MRGAGGEGLVIGHRAQARSISGGSAYMLSKRIVDMTVAALVLIVLLPLWSVIALAIKVTSPGPVLFRGTVVGRDGVPFRYYKFRSMRVEADNRIHQEWIKRYVSGNGLEDAGAGQFKLLGDPRVTAVGRIIRKLSLDEVPQLFNVLNGTMSIVGPRPPTQYEVDLFDDDARETLSVLPGLTGLAQVRARGKASYQRRIELDLEYVRTRSLALDLKIMAATPLVMLAGA
jgi:lipopolysaccharide/colanic/teichoic acid biosynthesis glycosyltransferase